MKDIEKQQLWITTVSELRAPLVFLVFGVLIGIYLKTFRLHHPMFCKVLKVLLK